MHDKQTELLETQSTEHTRPRDEKQCNQVYPPDTAYGLIAVVGAFFCLMLSIGVTTTYGVYLQEYKISIFPDASSSLLSWIGTLQFVSICFFGIGAGVLCEYYDMRVLSIIGSVIAGAGFIIASFCNSPWKLLLTQGVVFGIGSSVLHMVGLTIPSQWFIKYRALATGIAMTGSGLGGLWLSFSTRAMIKNLGYQWALRITGIIVIVLCGSSSLLLKTRVKPEKREKIIDFSPLKQPKFIMLFLAGLLGNGGYYITFYFIPSYAVIVLQQSQSWGTNLSSIMSGTSIAGRILTGICGDKFGPLNTLLLCTFLSCISILVLWLPFHSTGPFMAAVVIFGFCSGAIVSLLPVVAASLFGIKRHTMTMALLMIAYMSGGLIASPAAGEILDKYGHGTEFSSLIIYDGVLLGAATLMDLTLRIFISRNPLYRV